MAIIKKRVRPEYFEAIKSGKKKFDARIADFEIKPGDTLVLREWDPKTKKYTGRQLSKRVTYVLKTKDVKFWSEKEINKHEIQINYARAKTRDILSTSIDYPLHPRAKAPGICCYSIISLA